MTTITISLPDGRLDALIALSERFNLSIEELIYGSIDHLLSHPEPLYVPAIKDVKRSESMLPKGTPSQNLLKFAGLIPKEDLVLMEQAIEEGCGQIDWNEWE